MLNALAQAAGILTAVSAAADDCIIVASRDGIVLSWNDAAATLYGYTADEMIGRPLSVLVPEGNRGELAALLRLVDGGEAVTRREIAGRTRRGQALEVRLSAAPVRNATGEILGSAVVLHDITGRRSEQRRLRSTELRWRSIIESAVDGIVVIDSRGRIEAFNPAAERMFGYTEHEVLGRNVSLLMPSPYRGEHDNYLARYLREGEARIIGIGRDVQGMRRDGTIFPLHLSVGEMSIEGERKFTGILRDLSVRMRLEEQLREQTALARLGEMAAVIAHEIKNPLAGIRGAIQIIRGRIADHEPDAAILNEIVQRIDSLNTLMRDLLLFARAPTPRRSPIGLSPLIVSTADLLKADPALKNIKVDVAGSAPPIMADPDLLKIVFHNLLVNSAHALHGTGNISVNVTAGERDCRVTVTDHGVGIAPDARDRIFMPFFTTKSRGSGLGLATAKRLIEAHEGQIAVDSLPTGGTIVTVQLPSGAARGGAGERIDS